MSTQPSYPQVRSTKVYSQPQGAWWLSEDRHSIWVTPKGRDVLLHPLQGSDVVHEPVVPWKHGTVDPKGFCFSFPRKLGSNNNSADMVTSHVCQGSKSKDLLKVQKTVLQNIEKQPEKPWKVPEHPKLEPPFHPQSTNVQEATWRNQVKCSCQWLSPRVYINVFI